MSAAQFWPDRVTQPLNSGNVIAERPFEDNTRGGGDLRYICQGNQTFLFLGHMGLLERLSKQICY